MCGIIGVVAKNKGGLFKGHITMFDQLFWADQLRGTDGAGLFYDANSGVKVLKVPSEASVLIGSAEYDKALIEAVKEGHFIIGHNRAATKGEHTWENTHPFTEGGITLVHNGTLLSHKGLDADVEVDSHAICKHMAKNGHTNTLKEVDGAFALVWYDEESGTLNLSRNRQRPLHIVETTTAWVICSEAALGIWIAERNAQKVESVIALDTENVYTFDATNPVAYTKTKVEFFVWKGTKGYLQDWGFDDVYTPGYSGIGKYKKSHNNPPVASNPTGKKPDNVLHLTDQRANKAQVRAWGAKVTFVPHTLVDSFDKSTLTAILYDQEKKTHFLKGKITTEPLVELRYYGKWAELEPITKWGRVDATVMSTKITKNKVIHVVTNLVHVIGTAPNEKGVCSFCTKKIESKEEKRFNGMVLCESCCDTFKADPMLAHECGMC